MSVFGILFWLPKDSLEIHVIKGTWEATNFNWCALRFIFKAFTFSFDDLIIRGSLISNNQSIVNLFLTRKWAALGLGWQGASSCGPQIGFHCFSLVHSTKCVSHQLWAGYGAGKQKDTCSSQRAFILLKGNLNPSYPNPLPKETEGPLPPWKGTHQPLTRSMYRN